MSILVGTKTSDDKREGSDAEECNAPAWVDEDDEKVAVDIAEKAQLRKLRYYVHANAYERARAVVKLLFLSL